MAQAARVVHLEACVCGTGPGNTMVISNGGRVISRTGISYMGTGNSNQVVVTENAALLNNILYVGYQGFSNALVVSGGSVLAANLTVGFASTTRNNLVRLDDGDVPATVAAGRPLLLRKAAASRPVQNFRRAKVLAVV
jgi:hypothetical protein